MKEEIQTFAVQDTDIRSFMYREGSLSGKTIFSLLANGWVFTECLPGCQNKY